MYAFDNDNIFVTLWWKHPSSASCCWQFPLCDITYKEWNWC